MLRATNDFLLFICPTPVLIWADGPDSSKEICFSSVHRLPIMKGEIPSPSPLRLDKIRMTKRSTETLRSALPILLGCGLILGCGEVGNLSLREQAEQAFSEGDLALARDLSNHAIEEDPYDHYAYLIRGRSWLEDGNVELALKDYSQAIRLDPTDPQPYYFRADAYKLLGKDDRARADRREAHQKDPAYKRAFVFNQNELVADMQLSRNLAQQELETDAEELLENDASTVAPDKGNNKSTQFDLFEARKRLESEKRESQEETGSDDNITRKSIAERIREHELRSPEPRNVTDDITVDREKITDASTHRPQVPSGTTEFESWKNGLLQFEKSQELQQRASISKIAGESNPTDESLYSDSRLGTSTSEKTANPLDEKQKDTSTSPEETPITVPFRRSWKLSGGNPDSVPISSSPFEDSARRKFSINGRDTGPVTTGLNSRRASSTGSNSLSGPDLAGSSGHSASNRHRRGVTSPYLNPTGNSPNPRPWKRQTRHSATGPTATGEPTARSRKFRRNFLLPQQNKTNTGIQLGPNTTSVRNSGLPRP